jgi:amino acid transporter
MGIRGIFDGIYVDQLIQKNERGELVVYPHGMFGAGYMLPAELEPTMRRRVRTMMFISIVIGTVFAMLVMRVADASVTPLGWVVIAGIGGALIAGIIYYQRGLASGLQPVSGPQPSVGEWLRRGRQSRATWTYWFSAVLGLIMAPLSVAGIAAGFIDADLLVTVCSLFLLAVSLLAIWDGILGINERREA